MPTYDYKCGKCGFSGEYLFVKVNETPNCAGCGEASQMQRLPTASNVSTGQKDKAVEWPEARTQKVSSLEVNLGVADCSCGGKHPFVGIRKVQVDTGQSFN
jgi:putative FmdB family regulatory protein